MHFYKIILLILRLSLTVTAINHWILKDEVIIPKPESPFFMRDPNDLPFFLNQIKNSDNVEKAFAQLLRTRELIFEYLQFSAQYGRELLEQAKCAMQYYSSEKKISYLRLTNAYLRRIDLPNFKNGIPMHVEEPFCAQYAPEVEGCFHDESEIQERLEIAPEEDVAMGNTKYNIDDLRRIAVEILNTQAKSWKAHLIGSYYWRSRGNAREALNCACRSVTLAPNQVKDIAMLSLGIILFRAGCLEDAEVILTSATEIQPLIAENHFALGLTLAIKHESINRSLAYFDEAERLDPSIVSKTSPVRNFISCFENLSKKTVKMNSYVDFIRNELNQFKNLKQKLRKKHEELMHQQIPLSAREFINTDEMQKRGQYCSMRKLSGSEEPVLFCDFYSEMQMRLESKDLDISALERELKATSDAVIKQVSKELGTKVNVYELTTGNRDIPQKQKNSASKRF